VNAKRIISVGFIAALCLAASGDAVNAQLTFGVAE